MHGARDEACAVTETYAPHHTHPPCYQVHVKVKAPPATPSAALHCYHGFGSNTWSWSLVQQELADKLGALVTAHDMPGFGLTERWVPGAGGAQGGGHPATRGWAGGAQRRGRRPEGRCSGPGAQPPIP